MQAAAPLAPLLDGARLDHVSMCVHDRERTIERLGGLVAGPFDRFEYTNTALVYGKPSMYTLWMALAPLSPTLDLEIIQLKEGDNEIHARFLREKGEGLQHLAYEVDDFEASIEKFGAHGFAPILQKIGGTPVAVYIDTTGVTGCFIELIRKGFRLRDPSTWPR
jgi:hypothetical protein